MNQLNCVQMDGGGVDSDGREFKSAEEMWREEVGDGDPLKKSQWYSQGVGYWQVSNELCIFFFLFSFSNKKSVVCLVAHWRGLAFDSIFPEKKLFCAAVKQDYV